MLVKLSALAACLFLASCAGFPPARPHAEANPPAPPAASAAPAPAKPTAAVSVEVEGSSRDETKRPFLLALAGNASPTLREDEALRAVRAALVYEGYTPGLAGGAERPLNIKARFSKEAPRFGFFGGTKHGVHLEAFDADRLVWEFHASANGDQEDIRPLLPTLLAAGHGLIGGSTAGTRTVAVRDGENLPPPPGLPIPAPAAKKTGRRGLLQK